MKNTGLISCLLFFTLATLSSFTKISKLPPEKKEAVQILIVGLNDNVKSNYYYDERIAEETGMQVDSIVHHFNQIIAKNIAEAPSKSACKFVAHTDQVAMAAFAEKIELKVEGEHSSSNLSKIPAADYHKALDQANSSYLLVINQHYLKRQEQPMRTVFHIVSYTLYDKDQKEVLSGNQFYTAMKLESADKMKQISRKSTAKIAASVAKSLSL